MRRTSLALLACVLCSIVWASPALAGEEVDGDGYAFRLPDGFAEAMSVESAGNVRIRSRFGNLPIDGVPEVRAYTAGEGMPPHGTVVVARVNLSRSISTAEELGLDDMDQLRGQLPGNIDVRATKVSGFNAVEIVAHNDMLGEERTSRILSVAAGDYVVVLMLETSDEAFGNSASMWTGMLSSLEVQPGMNKLLLFGLLGVGGLGGLYVLSRIGRREAVETPDYTGRFQRFQDGPATDPEAGSGFQHREAPQYGRRPKVLTSRREANPDAGPGRARPAPAPPPPSGPRGGGFAQDGARAPVRTPTSPAVTRPAHQAPPSKPGLRTTLPQSGRWGT